MAVLYVHRDDYLTSIKFYKMYLELNPYDWEMHTALGHAYIAIQ
jgi:hypothetical protein